MASPNVPKSKTPKPQNPKTPQYYFELLSRKINWNLYYLNKQSHSLLMTESEALNTNQNPDVVM